MYKHILYRQAKRDQATGAQAGAGVQPSVMDIHSLAAAAAAVHAAIAPLWP